MIQCYSLGSAEAILSVCHVFIVDHHALFSNAIGRSSDCAESTVNWNLETLTHVRTSVIDVCQVD